MAEKKKHALQRVVYRKASSAVRRWRAKPLKKTTQRRLKIFTNVQSASVAGITRVISSFAGSVNSTSDTYVEWVYVSVDAKKLQHKNTGWRREETGNPRIASCVYEGAIPDFRDVLESSHTVNDVQSAHQHLVDAYCDLLKQEKPDLVLVNGTYIVAWALMTAARRLRLPVTLYYHGSLTKETEHWKKEKDRRLMRQLELSFDRADLKYIFPSHLIKQYVEQSVFGHTIRRDTALVLPNPIPEEFFLAAIPKQKKGVAFVGRWTRIKNTAFVSKFAGLNARYKYPLEIFLVTDEMGRTKAGKILKKQVTFAGPFMTSKAMRQFFAERAIILCPSHFETYGNVAQEAVAAGTPALVSRKMGVAEVFNGIGLEKLVVSFKEPERVFDMVIKKNVPTITNSARKALREKAGENVVHQKLLEFIKK